MPKTVFTSTILHGVLLCLVGCAIHKHLAAPTMSPKVLNGRDFVAAVAEKMPLWDEDAVSRYEKVEIATVKADIEVAKLAATEEAFLEAVDKLDRDFGKLVALDNFLKVNSLI